MAIETMTCTCSTPNQSCNNARERILGYYCSLTLPATHPTKLRQLRHGQKFSFKETEWLTNTVHENFGNYLVYIRSDGWFITTEDLDRVVNLVSTV